MARVDNFNAGPAALPLAALERAQREMLEYDGSGMSIMEHSHRGKVYEAVHNEAIALLRELMGISDEYDVLFLQGGASQQFAVVPMNFLGADDSADYIITGTWSEKAFKEAGKIGKPVATIDCAVDKSYTRVPKPEEVKVSNGAKYVHITSNNTIAGTQYHAFPDTGSTPLIADMSSDILWKKVDVSKFGLIYAGAQKNIGPSGVTVVIVKKSLVESGRKDIPSIFRYETHAKANSLSNTPPTFAIYMVRNVLSLLHERGGLDAIEKENKKKGELLYAALSEMGDFYKCPVEESSRSLMNVVFRLPSEDQEKAFVAAAAEKGLVGLKGHRSVGGIRASTYNAVSFESVERLVAFMKDFKSKA